MEPRKHKEFYTVNRRDCRSVDSLVGVAGGACGGAGQQRRDCCVLHGKWAAELCQLFMCSAVRFLVFGLETQVELLMPLMWFCILKSV